MRKVKYSVGVTLDGYWLERAKGDIKGEDFGMREFFKSIDTVLMGPKTYEQALAMGASKPIFPKMKNLVFSRTLASGQRDGMEFVSNDPAKVITKMKEEPGKDIRLCAAKSGAHFRSPRPVTRYTAKLPSQWPPS